MTTPSFGGKPAQIIHPNGETVLYLNPYTGTYTKSRSYGLRMQRGYSRGIRQHEARGKPAGEAAIRREQIREKYNQTPWERFKIGFEARYGFSYSYWRRIRRIWVDEINAMTSKDGFGYITPASIFMVIQAFRQGVRDPRSPEIRDWQDWVELNLDERLAATYAYQEERDPLPGRGRFYSRPGIFPIEFFYYH